MQKTVLGAGVAVAGTAAAYGYAALSPASQIFGRTIIAGHDPREIALTYDDGPNDPETTQLLELLQRYSVRATFFCIGRFVRSRPDIVRAIAAAGHVIGNHTYTHPALLFRAPSTVKRELRDANTALEDVLGHPVGLFRPPHGARRPDVLRAANELGLQPVMWNAMGYDWKPMMPEMVISHVLGGVHKNFAVARGSNVLLHDGGQHCIGADRAHTVRATGMLLDRWLGEGFRFVTPERWANLHA